MSSRRLSVPLSGSDYFALALDHDMRRSGLAGNVCRLVVDLDGHLDAARLREAIDASGMEPWFANAAYSRRLPFIKPCWRRRGRARRLRIAEHVTPPAPRPGQPEGSDLSLPGGDLAIPSYPLTCCFDLVHRSTGRTSLVLTWHHGMMDARGAELLLSHINTPAEPEQLAGLLFGAEPQRLHQQFREWFGVVGGLREARRSLMHVDEASHPPIASADGNGVSRVGARNRFRILPFTQAETARVGAHGDRVGASFRHSLFYLAATVRALEAVRAGRGAGPASYLVPVPQDRRRRGAAGPVFSNRVSFFFYRAEPADVASIEALVAALARQMTDQVRRGVPDSFAKAMDMFQRVPLAWYARILHGPSGGQFASLFFSDTGHWRGAGEASPAFLGMPVVDLTHLAPVSSPPGLGVVCSTFEGRLAVVLSWVEGVLGEDEIDLMARTLRAELLGGGADR